MELHEFQAKQVLSRYAIGCPQGRVAITPDEAEAAARDLGSPTLFVKAQIHAGARAKAGGVRKVQSAAAARTAAKELLGQKLATTQTGRDGLTVKKVLVEAGIRSVHELYLTMVVDASSGSLMLMAGASGGTEIEERADSGLANLEILHLNSKGESQSGDIANFCRRIGLSEREAASGRDLIVNLHRAFIALDASLIEINPLAVTESGELIALDAKIVLDDNALFRHPDLAELREQDEIDEIELKAQRHQLNFMQMDGDIGVVVNGAGLALATLDMIRSAGGNPANFMDIRTTAKSLDIAQGVSLVLDNPRAKVLLVNVYGGGMQACDTIIEGLGIAIRRKGRALPIALRLTGNNEDIARLRLASFKLPAIECADMWQAATRAVAIAQGRS